MSTLPRLKALKLLVLTAFAFALMHPCNAQTLTTLYSFTGGANGAGPQSGLAMGANGVLYGTTLGGTTNNGTVFELIPPAATGGAWTQRVIHQFAGPPGDGYYPVGTLAIGRDGALYGTTYEGGAHGASIKAGTVFELSRRHRRAAPGRRGSSTASEDPSTEIAPSRA
jgi:hypothetical protein